MSSYSRTAEYMALFRALETARGAPARLFNDPFAAAFLRPSLRAAALAARLPPAHAAICRTIDRRWPGARTSGIARTRFIDDALAQAMANGFGQIVLLGAGFDSRAYRLAGITDALVFEVDHPATSQLKRRRVTAILGHGPAHVRFVPLDFNRQNIATSLREAGLDASRKTFFLWEGVTNYLDAQAVDAMLRHIATTQAGSRVLFTYIDRDVLRPDSTYQSAASVHALVRRAGEPWRFGFDPAELERYLSARGLHLLSDLGANEYRALCWPQTAHAMTGYEFYRIATAEIAPHAEG